MPKTDPPRKALQVLCAALSLFCAACAGSTAFYRTVDDRVAAGNYGGAIEEVRNNAGEYGDKSSVLFDLDLGLLYHYQGNNDSSNVHLFAAERRIQELFTKSISLAALSVLTNDNVLPYDGEDFERVLINVFLALNYAREGKPDDALVEARKVDLKLREYSRQYDEKNRYKEDAFIRYIAGALYEAQGEINDAFISYRNAYTVYQAYDTTYGTPAPSFLLDDIVRTATLLSFNDEAARFESLGGHPFDRTGRSEGTIIVLTYTGKGPIKQEVRPTVSIADEKGVVHTFQVALPKFAPRFTPGRSYDVRVQGKGTLLHAESETAEDITAIAAKALDDRLTMIYLKSGGRALLKFLAAEAAKAKIKKDDGDKSTLGNFLGSIAVDIAVGLSEKADLRTWRTLPSEIQMTRLRVPPGEYTVDVVSSDGGYSSGAIQVALRPGRFRFVIIDDVR